MVFLSATPSHTCRQTARYGFHQGSFYPPCPPGEPHYEFCPVRIYVHSVKPSFFLEYLLYGYILLIFLKSFTTFLCILLKYFLPQVLPDTSSDPFFFQLCFQLRFFLLSVHSVTKSRAPGDAISPSISPSRVSKANVVLNGFIFFCSL